MAPFLADGSGSWLGEAVGAVVLAVLGFFSRRGHKDVAKTNERLVNGISDKLDRIDKRTERTEEKVTTLDRRMTSVEEHVDSLREAHLAG